MQNRHFVSRDEVCSSLRFFIQYSVRRSLNPAHAGFPPLTRNGQARTELTIGPLYLQTYS